MGRYHWGANAFCSFLANDLQSHPWDHKYYTELIKKPYGELALIQDSKILPLYEETHHCLISLM